MDSPILHSMKANNKPSISVITSPSLINKINRIYILVRYRIGPYKLFVSNITDND
ncbi:hypothetical protein PMIT1306_00713 [Prochlorococcus sp. MIT 1306]|nr:hypothetical protein PMIT1306_00713 [Prochlorococcus sp. MIT 1306]